MTKRNCGEDPLSLVAPPCVHRSRKEQAARTLPQTRLYLRFAVMGQVSPREENPTSEQSLAGVPVLGRWSLG
jgi:hypothetical protein